jgi:hypothetical protein
MLFGTLCLVTVSVGLVVVGCTDVTDLTFPVVFKVDVVDSDVSIGCNSVSGGVSFIPLMIALLFLLYVVLNGDDGCFVSFVTEMLMVVFSVGILKID